MEVSLLTALVCWLVISFARVRLSQLGLYSWPTWSKTEKFYLLQIVPIAIVVFSFFVSASLKALWARPNLWGDLLVHLCTKDDLGVLSRVSVSRRASNRRVS